MNQPIFVHANSESLPPLTVSNSLASDTNVQKSANSPSLGAVIRPTRQANTLENPVRADSPANAAVPVPHVRTHKLEDYVKWLRNHAAAKRTAESHSPLTKPDVVMPTPDATVSEVDNYVPKPSRGSSVDQIQRIDGAHHSINAPVISATQFPIDPDLQRLQATLMSEEVLLPENVEEQTSAVYDSENSQAAVQPSSAAQVDPDEIIRTVAQAIASVLTDQSELSIEKKIRKQLAQDGHEEPLAALPPEDAQEIFAAVAEAVETQTIQESTQIPSPHLQNGRANQEIPTTIAAWDVEDFRWPSVTNQMIVSGSEAIAQLANSVFSLMGTTSRRLAITSPGRGEGTTSVAISLARWAAASGKKVLLVDADLASPGLSGQVGLGPNISWINAVSNSLDPCEVIIRSQKTPVCVMPMTPIVTRVTWPRFIYDSLGALTEKVQSSFDLIIFDVGPTSQLVAELSNSSLMIDAGLIVHNGVGASNFQKAKDRLQEFGISKYLVAQNSVQQTDARVHPNVA